MDTSIQRNTQMKKGFIIICVLFASLKLSAQTFTLSGNIKNSSGSGIVAATVSLKGTPYITNCNDAGNYQLKDIKPGDYKLRVSAIGFETVERAINISGDVKLDIKLDSAVNQLNQVNIINQKDK